MKRAVFVTLLMLQLAVWTVTVMLGQFDAVDLDHPAIRYSEEAPTGAVERLNRRLQSGGLELQFETGRGYLKSLLAALEIPVESQLAVYSKTSLQALRVSPSNPRVIFFNDTTAVSWVPGGFIEVASHDPRLGAVFYLLEQTPAPVPQLVRDERCPHATCPRPPPVFPVSSCAAFRPLPKAPRFRGWETSRRTIAPRCRSDGAAGTSPHNTRQVPISATP
jgi:hypothetical protein